MPRIRTAQRKSADADIQAGAPDAGSLPGGDFHGLAPCPVPVMIACAMSVEAGPDHRRNREGRSNLLSAWQEHCAGAQDPVDAWGEHCAGAQDRGDAWGEPCAGAQDPGDAWQEHCEGAQDPVGAWA